LHRWFFRALVLLAVILLVVGLIRWKGVLSYLGDFLVSPQTPQSADLILVLGGDFWGSRVVKGADLAMQGYAPLVLFSGTPYQGRMDGELAIEFLAAKGYPTHKFQSFGQRTSSTIEEAIVLRGELERRGVKRVLLVTSAYHSRRAAIVYWLFCPSIQFITIAAPDPKEYNPDIWWEDARSKKLFFAEWSKILGTVFVEYPRHLLKRMLREDGS
jgi:uncharacterized SAM-binding protein YcdF (DUF218 family)